MREITISSAISEAVQIEMSKDPNIVVVGEDIINSSGCFSEFMGVPQKFPDRCFDMPIAESGFTHFANGAALAGLRPIVDLMFSDFATIAADAIINGGATFRFCTLGQVKVPIVYLLGNGGCGTYDGVGVGCHHSQCMEALFLNTPGLKIAMPYYPSDILGMLRSAIQDNDPVVFLYHEGSLGVRETVPDGEILIPLNNAAKIMRKGTDLTIIALQSMVPLAVEAASQLEKKGISVELIDPRMLIPFDSKKVIDSVRKTGKLIIVHEAHSRGGFAGEIVKTIMEESADIIKKPVKVLGALNAPLGSGFTEAYIMPHVKDIVEAAEVLVK